MYQIDVWMNSTNEIRKVRPSYGMRIAVSYIERSIEELARTLAGAVNLFECPLNSEGAENTDGFPTSPAQMIIASSPAQRKHS
jgi:hypothetical protein